MMTTVMMTMTTTVMMIMMTGDDDHDDHGDDDHDDHGDDDHDDHGDDDHDDHGDDDHHEGHEHSEAEMTFENPEACPAETTIQVSIWKRENISWDFESEHDEKFQYGCLEDARRACSPPPPRSWLRAIRVGRDLQYQR